MAKQQAVDAVTEEDAATAQSILNIFDQQDEDGSYLFADEEVRHFLPMLILGAGFTQEECTPEMMDVLGEFCQLSGVDLEAPGSVVQERIQAFYAEYPPHPALQSAFEAFLRERKTGGGQDLANAAAARLTGRQDSKMPVGAQGKVKGAVSGGPLGRMAANEALSKKKK